MYKLAPEIDFLRIDQSAISVVYQSVNSASVLLPGQSSVLARAYVIGHKLESRRYAVLVALHLTEQKRHLFYLHDEGELDPEGARLAATEAIAFAESMGFFMENADWRNLDVVDQRELLAGMQVFQPPEPPKEAPKVVDPRTKLARLLVQF